MEEEFWVWRRGCGEEEFFEHMLQHYINSTFLLTVMTLVVQTSGEARPVQVSFDPGMPNNTPTMCILRNGSYRKARPHVREATYKKLQAPHNI